MFDFSSLLYPPIYQVFGVPATFTALGESVPVNTVMPSIAILSPVKHLQQAGKSDRRYSRSDQNHENSVLCSVNNDGARRDLRRIHGDVCCIL